MNTNYDSARGALALCMRLAHVEPFQPVECLLPADDHYKVCTPAHLAAAVALAGIDCELYETRRVGLIVHGALQAGRLAICLAGLHSAPEKQRWIVAIDRAGSIIEFAQWGFDEPLLDIEPAHFAPAVIVVHGVVDPLARLRREAWPTT